MAEIYDFKIDQGETWNRTIIYKPAGNPINLTGYTARMMLKRKFSNTEPQLELTTANSRIVLGGSAGTITLSLTDEETAALTGEYLYDIEIVSPTGNVTRVLQGKIIINPEVTR